jgi:hypothetical protein
MNRKLFLPRLFFLLTLGCALSSSHLKAARAASLRDERTLVLYEADSGAIPNPSLMNFTDFPPGAATLTYADSATILDTSPSGSDTFAGWVSGQAITPEFPTLDRAAGFQLNFTLQVESEAHEKNNRAGFSVILLDQAAKGIELAFWEDEIWAQNDDRTGRLFSHGEGAAMASTNGLMDYQVSITGDTYILTANGSPLLSGAVRDYSKFDGFPDPYETPNFLFLGDDTSVAQARVRLRFVSVTGTQPILPATTKTSSGNFQPAATFTPLPSATPLLLPTPGPAGNVFKVCSSGWVALGVATGSVVFGDRARRQYRKRS